MKNICLCFEVHQPLQLKRYRFFDIGKDPYYSDDFQTEDRIRQLAEESYLPANKTLLEMIRATNGKFKCAFSISGIALEQLEQYAPDVMDSFKELSKTGAVEFIAETYAHSLASVFDENEFERQVILHSKKMEDLFGKKPTVFRNAELIYSDTIGELVSKLGFKTMLIEEAKHVMGWKSPNTVYAHINLPKLKLLVRNNKFSDDIAFRFSNHSWSEFPLDAAKYLNWIANTPENEEVINIWMGYEALGIFQRAETGIFDFLKALPYHAMENGVGFTFPSEAAKKIEAKDTLHVPFPISWSGDKDLSVWKGNDLQTEALEKLYIKSERIRMCNDKSLQHNWMMLQTSDNFRYMCHYDSYGSNYSSPYEAFTNYMNILSDFLDRVAAQYPSVIEDEELNELLKTIHNQEKEIATLKDELKKVKAKKSK